MRYEPSFFRVETFAGVIADSELLTELRELSPAAVPIEIGPGPEYPSLSGVVI
jgi:hypothetical protein